MVLSKTSLAATLTNFETYNRMLFFNCYCNVLILVPPRKNGHLPGFAVKCIRPQKILVMVTNISNDVVIGKSESSGHRISCYVQKYVKHFESPEHELYNGRNNGLKAMPGLCIL